MHVSPDPSLDHAWEEIKAGNLDEAERIFREAAKSHPKAADPWNGIGAVHFERGELKESLAAYERARELALAARGDVMPKSLAWNDADRPLLRAIHGIGLNRFRLGKFDDACKSFELLLKLNPADNQGARMLLKDALRRSDLWKRSGHGDQL